MPDMQRATDRVDRASVTAASEPWRRSAVIYQVYIRSFADGNGDGVGDIAGLRSRLDYLADLGVDAIWINPWYPSPMKDAGYDVSDHRAIEPVFGTLDEAAELIREAHDRGLRVLLDIVPNHTSDQHPWFRQALAAPAGSPERDRFLFRDGRGPGGNELPNDWISQFGGPAWSRVSEVGPDGLEIPEQWYVHLYTPEQPDLNWANADVRADFERTLRFWFDRGVDGFRIDVAHSLTKAEGMPDVGEIPWPPAQTGPQVDHPHWDRDEVHEIYRDWRDLADEYADPRVFVAEAWVTRPERLARYVRADELHTAFNFDFLLTPWLAHTLRTSITDTIASHREVSAPPTWVLSNHDVAREVSRYARPQSDRRLRSLDDLLPLPSDPDLGVRRARAAALLMLALPGGAYIYQGEELGLPEVEDLPDEVLDDPKFEQSGRTSRGRDGCRVPLPWSGDRPPFGFSPDGVNPWLPQPDRWGSLTAERELDDPESMVSLYRSALRIRRVDPALGDGDLEWLDMPDDAIGFTREPGFSCLVNLSADPLEGPTGSEILLASGLLSDNRRIPADTAVWLTRR